MRPKSKPPDRTGLRGFLDDSPLSAFVPDATHVLISKLVNRCLVGILVMNCYLVPQKVLITKVAKASLARAKNWPPSARCSETNILVPRSRFGESESLRRRRDGGGAGGESRGVGAREGILAPAAARFSHRRDSSRRRERIAGLCVHSPAYRSPQPRAFPRCTAQPGDLHKHPRAGAWGSDCSAGADDQALEDDEG